MILNSLTLHNYRGFENLCLNLNEHLNVIVGVNGAGKTSILESAAIALGTFFTQLNGLNGLSIKRTDAHLKSFELGEAEDIQSQYPVEITAIGAMEGKSISWKRRLNSETGKTTLVDAKEVTRIASEYQSKMSQGNKQLVLPMLAYYGTGRLWDYHREKKEDSTKKNTRTNGYINSLDGTANVKLMMIWFKTKTIQKYQRQEEGKTGPVEFEVVCNAMEKAFASVAQADNVKIMYNLNSNELDVLYTENSKRMRIALSQLSDGYKSTISLIADIAYRMAVINPQLMENVLEATPGIVLIDEIDLHLHPAWQQHILDDLLSIFPQIQFIVTSHAPSIINSVKADNLIILKDNTCFRASDEVYGKDVKSVMNEIMGVKERPVAVAQLFETFYTLLVDKKFDEAEHILDQLDLLRGYHDSEIASCRVKLKLERIRGGQR